VVLLTALASVGCDKSGLKSPTTDGSLTDVPFGTGAPVPDGSGGAGGDGQGGAGDSGWEAPTPPPIRVSAAVLDFGAADVGSTSAAQVVAVTVGVATALNPTVVGAGFAISGTTCTNPQTPGTCTISVIFTPVTIGSASGVLAIGTSTVLLTGAGVSGSFSVTDRVDLGTVQINQTATVVVQVNTSSAIGMTCIANGPDLTLTSQTCPASGAILSSCTFTFVFKASTTGTKSESVVCSSAGRTTQTVVAATVVADVSPVINPPWANFTSTIGKFTVASFTFGNVGGSPTGYLTVAITTGGTDFSIVANACTGPIAPLATCKIQVGFTPATFGAKAGTLTVTDQASGQIAVASLIGTAIDAIPDPIIKPLSQDFGSVTVGTTKTVSFTVTNTGSAASGVLDLASGSTEFTVDPQACKNASIEPGGQCIFAVTFAPTSPGGKTTAVGLTRSDGAAVATTQVSGAGVVADAGPPVLDAGYVAGLAAVVIPMV